MTTFKAPSLSDLYVDAILPTPHQYTVDKCLVYLVHSSPEQSYYLYLIAQTRTDAEEKIKLHKALPATVRVQSVYHYYPKQLIRFANHDAVLSHSTDVITQPELRTFLNKELAAVLCSATPDKLHTINMNQLVGWMNTSSRTLHPHSLLQLCLAILEAVQNIQIANQQISKLIGDIQPADILLYPLTSSSSSSSSSSPSTYQVVLAHTFLASLQLPEKFLPKASHYVPPFLTLGDRQSTNDRSMRHALLFNLVRLFVKLAAPGFLLPSLVEQPDTWKKAFDGYQHELTDIMCTWFIKIQSNATIGSLSLESMHAQLTKLSHDNVSAVPSNAVVLDASLIQQLRKKAPLKLLASSSPSGTSTTTSSSSALPTSVPPRRYTLMVYYQSHIPLQQGLPLKIPLEFDTSRSAEDIWSQLHNKIVERFRLPAGNYHLCAYDDAFTELSCADMTKFRRDAAVLCFPLDVEHRIYQSVGSSFSYAPKFKEFKVLAEYPSVKEVPQAFSYALAEFIDNSLSAMRHQIPSEREIDIEFLETSDDMIILIRDNGEGMTAEVIKQFAQMGNSRTERKIKRDAAKDSSPYLSGEIGQYGVGAKQSAFYLGNALTVISAHAKQVHEFSMSMKNFAEREAAGEDVYTGNVKTRTACKQYTNSEIDEKLKQVDRIQRLLEQEAQRPNSTSTTFIVSDLDEPHKAVVKKHDQIIYDLCHIYLFYLFGMPGLTQQYIDDYSDKPWQPFVRISLSWYSKEGKLQRQIKDLAQEYAERIYTAQLNGKVNQLDRTAQYWASCTPNIFYFMGTSDDQLVHWEGALAYYPFDGAYETQPDAEADPPIFLIYWCGRLIPNATIASWRSIDALANKDKKVGGDTLKRRLKGWIHFAPNDRFKPSRNKLRISDNSIDLVKLLNTSTCSRIVKHDERGCVKQKTDRKVDFEQWARAERANHDIEILVEKRDKSNQLKGYKAFSYKVNGEDVRIESTDILALNIRADLQAAIDNVAAPRRGKKQRNSMHDDNPFVEFVKLDMPDQDISTGIFHYKVLPEERRKLIPDIKTAPVSYLRRLDKLDIQHKYSKYRRYIIPNIPNYLELNTTVHFGAQQVVTQHFVNYYEDEDNTTLIFPAGIRFADQIIDLCGTIPEGANEPCSLRSDNYIVRRCLIRPRRANDGAGAENDPEAKQDLQTIQPGWVFDKPYKGINTSTPNDLVFEQFDLSLASLYQLEYYLSPANQIQLIIPFQVIAAKPMHFTVDATHEFKQLQLSTTEWLLHCLKFKLEDQYHNAVDQIGWDVFSVQCTLMHNGAAVNGCHMTLRRSTSVPANASGADLADYIFFDAQLSLDAGAHIDVGLSLIAQFAVTQTRVDARLAQSLDVKDQPFMPKLEHALTQQLSLVTMGGKPAMLKWEEHEHEHNAESKEPHSIELCNGDSIPSLRLYMVDSLGNRCPNISQPIPVRLQISSEHAVHLAAVEKVQGLMQQHSNEYISHVESNGSVGFTNIRIKLRKHWFAEHADNPQVRVALQARTTDTQDSILSQPLYIVIRPSRIPVLLRVLCPSAQSSTSPSVRGTSSSSHDNAASAFRIPVGAQVSMQFQFVDEAKQAISIQEMKQLYQSGGLYNGAQSADRMDTSSDGVDTSSHNRHRQRQRAGAVHPSSADSWEESKLVVCIGSEKKAEICLDDLLTDPHSYTIHMPTSVPKPLLCTAQLHSVLSSTLHCTFYLDPIYEAAKEVHMHGKQFICGQANGDAISFSVHDKYGNQLVDFSTSCHVSFQHEEDSDQLYTWKCMLNVDADHNSSVAQQELSGRCGRYRVTATFPTHPDLTCSGDISLLPSPVPHHIIPCLHELEPTATYIPPSNVAPLRLHTHQFIPHLALYAVDKCGNICQDVSCKMLVTLLLPHSKQVKSIPVENGRAVLQNVVVSVPALDDQFHSEMQLAVVERSRANTTNVPLESIPINLVPTPRLLKELSRCTDPPSVSLYSSATWPSVTYKGIFEDPQDNDSQFTDNDKAKFTLTVHSATGSKQQQQQEVYKFPDPQLDENHCIRFQCAAGAHIDQSGQFIYRLSYQESDIGLKRTLPAKEKQVINSEYRIEVLCDRVRKIVAIGPDMKNTISTDNTCIAERIVFQFRDANNKVIGSSFLPFDLSSLSIDCVIEDANKQHTSMVLQHYDVKVDSRGLLSLSPLVVQPQSTVGYNGKYLVSFMFPTLSHHPHSINTSEPIDIMLTDRTAIYEVRNSVTRSRDTWKSHGDAIEQHKRTLNHLLSQVQQSEESYHNIRKAAHTTDPSQLDKYIDDLETEISNATTYSKPVLATRHQQVAQGIPLDDNYVGMFGNLCAALPSVHMAHVLSSWLRGEFGTHIVHRSDDNNPAIKYLRSKNCRIMYLDGAEDAPNRALPPLHTKAQLKFKGKAYHAYKLLTDGLSHAQAAAIRKAAWNLVDNQTVFDKREDALNYGKVIKRASMISLDDKSCIRGAIEDFGRKCEDFETVKHNVGLFAVHTHDLQRQLRDASRVKQALQNIQQVRGFLPKLTNEQNRCTQSAAQCNAYLQSCSQLLTRIDEADNAEAQLDSWNEESREIEKHSQHMVQTLQSLEIAISKVQQDITNCSSVLDSSGQSTLGLFHSSPTSMEDTPPGGPIHIAHVHALRSSHPAAASSSTPPAAARSSNRRTAAQARLQFDDSVMTVVDVTRSDIAYEHGPPQSKRRK